MYKDYCMEFTNEELEELFIKAIQRHSEIVIIRRSAEGELINQGSSIPIETISLDGEQEDLFIIFFGMQTLIFVQNTEIMLIDESAKGTYTSSDLYHNVVYEGELRNLTHLEIFEFLIDIIECFISDKENEVTELDVPSNKKYKKYNYYEPHCYVINVMGNEVKGRQKIFENITINY